jgi:hypothetical protein
MLDSVEGLTVALLGGFSGLKGISTQEQSGELRDRLVLEFWVRETVNLRFSVNL